MRVDDIQTARLLHQSFDSSFKFVHRCHDACIHLWEAICGTGLSHVGLCALGLVRSQLDVFPVKRSASGVTQITHEAIVSRTEFHMVSKRARKIDVTVGGL